jgi:LDH2 family malate/lactate/ureidoglycolate dehydrogenase
VSTFYETPTMAAVDSRKAMEMMQDSKIPGGLTPVGIAESAASYKGYGLAMMGHILGGTLNGGSLSLIREKVAGRQ